MVGIANQVGIAILEVNGSTESPRLSLPTISWTGSEEAAGDSDGKIADSESDEILIEVVHLSVRVKTAADDDAIGLYHDF